jgi:hypothetical protein
LCVLQSWFSPAKPTQSAPPYCGTGFVHVLDLFCDPPPQVTEHVSQFVQSSQSPSTRKQTDKRNININPSDINKNLVYEYIRRTYTKTELKIDTKQEEAILKVLNYL